MSLQHIFSYLTKVKKARFDEIGFDNILCTLYRSIDHSGYAFMC